jgi:diguanylate cyclase (GGDEF)-like protein
MQNDILETSRQMEQTIQRLQKSALIDEVTGAGNERMLIAELDANLEEASTRNGGICLAMIKLNNLDQIEDEAGEADKNDILIGIYRRLRRTVRPTDVIARLDNDVFSIVMNHTQIGSFKMNALDRIMAAINQRPFKTEKADYKVSSSIGVHYYDGNNDEPISSTEMLELTQKNLTKAIAQGDNSIIS